MLIEEEDDSRVYPSNYIRGDLLEEDLKLWKKLDDLEQALYRMSKELKPTLLTM